MNLRLNGVEVFANGLSKHCAKNPDQKKFNSVPNDVNRQKNFLFPVEDGS
jgi:hypothetical protein